MLRYTNSPVANYSSSAFPQLDDYASGPSPATDCGDAYPFSHTALAEADRPGPLQAMLQQFMRLENDEIAALGSLASHTKLHDAGHILIHEGGTTDYVYLLVEGTASRYKLLPGGERQILGFLIPGDICDVQFITHRPDHSVALLSRAKIAKIPSRKMTEFLIHYPRIEWALSRAALLDIAILRQWLLNIGQRDACERLSHLFCEMKCRLSKIGKVESDGSFDMPVNQSALADCTGLSIVHINRTLQRLRNDGLIELRRRRLTILDPERLATLAGFSDDYLQVKPCRS